MTALRRYWGRVDIIAFPIGHAGTTITTTLDHLTTAFSTVQPTAEISQTNRGDTIPATDHNPKSHDYTMFKSLMASLTDLAQSRLLGIIRNMKRLIDVLQGGVRHHRAYIIYSVVSPAHHHAAPEQEAATHIHRTRTTRAPESTAITWI